MRLIDANEFEALMQAQMARGATIIEAMDDALQDATVVDAVEVVRCKDCKYAAEIEKPYVKDFFVSGVKRCKACRGDNSYGFSESIVSPDDFCNEGERKE